MKISSINVYSTPAFSARKTGKYSGQPTETRSNHTLGKAVVGVGLAATTLVGAALLPSCSNNTQTTAPSETQPGYVVSTEADTSKDTIEETISVQENPNQIHTSTITTRPESERNAVWHEVKSGDRLADIVKEYAELDKLTPDSELVPYYLLLEADNPGKWESRDKILIGTRFRVDSIFPENIIKTSSNSSNQAVPHVQEQIQKEEILPTEEPQLTSDDDKVEINGNLFTFDLGTLDKKIFGDYEGLMYGKFVELDKKINGNLILTRHEGSNSDSDVIQQLIYNDDGNITTVSEYQGNKPSKVYTYVYRIDSTEETMVDKTAKSNHINEIKTVFDGKEDRVNSREFLSNGKTVANFDFLSGFAQIGEKLYSFDEGTFVCNDDVIGSKKYTGQINGEEVRIDVLKNGFCVEYIDARGEISSREQYDSTGSLICVE